jgi:signal transduction histidine kinase
VAFSVGTANWVFGPRSKKPWANYENISGFVDAELSPLLDDPDELQAKVKRVHRAFGFDVAIYRRDGTLLAHAGETPEPLSEMPERHTWLYRGAALPLDGGRAYTVVQWEGGGWGAAVVPLVVLLVLALASIPLARSIARPIEKITRAARAVGDGHLEARTGVDRRDEVGALASAFDDMAARLERMVAGEKELRANVSHELRTPLARIRVALEIAEEGDSPEAIQKHLRGIRGDIIELEELVDQVLITARLDLADDEELALRKTSFDVDELIQQSADRFRELHGEHELEIASSDEALAVQADEKLVKRVIDNLLDNSAKYASPADGPIRAQASCEGGAVVVAVSDRGIGVAPDEIERLFEPFFRADSTRAVDAKGVGLGLSFCRRVVTAHGGDISAQRRDGGGLTVRFTLPRA